MIQLGTKPILWILRVWRVENDSDSRRECSAPKSNGGVMGVQAALRQEFVP